MDHTRACMANAAIAAIQNFRDADWLDAEFLTALDRDVLTTADGYLNDKLMGCICPPTNGHPEAHGQSVKDWRADRDAALKPDYTWSK